MNTMLRTGVLLLLSAVLVAQEVKVPALDASALAVWRQVLTSAEDSLKAHGAIVEKLPEYQAYRSVLTMRDELRAQLNKELATKAPGYKLDMTTWRLVPLAPKATETK
jgi:hypothetical protein